MQSAQTRKTRVETQNAETQSQPADQGRRTPKGFLTGQTARVRLIHELHPPRLFGPGFTDGMTSFPGIEERNAHGTVPIEATAQDLAPSWGSGASISLRQSSLGTDLLLARKRQLDVMGIPP